MPPLYAHTFDPVDLVRNHPPILRDDNVELLYSLSAEDGTGYPAPLVCTRWPAQALPPCFPVTTVPVETRPGFFTYDPFAPNTCDWHLNFAHHDLFCFYGSGLFAQDEMQVAEHPILASVREALRSHRLSTLVVEQGQPTPILVQHALRRLHIATEPNPAEHRPEGLYGNRFSEASESAVRRAAHKLTPPTLSNILAIEAPPGGQGAYSRAQIEFILTTAYSGFYAAKKASENLLPVIHTGFWGCGAFGGNRVLMVLLQLAAARLAQVARIVFHTGGPGGESPCRDALAAWTTFAGEHPSLPAFIDAILARNYRWGTSDGN